MTVYLWPELFDKDGRVVGWHVEEDRRMTHPAADTKSIVCVRQPDGGLQFYVNGLMLPVLYAVEECGRREGHTVTLKLAADCIDFQPKPHYYDDGVARP